MKRVGGMARIAVALLGVAAYSSNALADAPANAWQGHYRFDFDGGQTAGGSAISVRYDLTIGPGGERGCLLSSQGFQTDETIVCHASGDDRKLTVAFHRYPDGRLVNKNGVAVYKPAQALFTLERTADGARLSTSWEALRPGDDKTPSHGEFFEKVE